MSVARLGALSDREIRGLSKTQSVGVVPGLECVVSANGTKSWRLLYRLAGDASGRRRSIGLGRYPVVSLAEARKRAQKYIQQASEGIDPKHKLQEHAAKQDVLLAAVAENYIAWSRTENAHETAEDKLSVFRAHVIPHMGKRPIDSIRKVDVSRLLDKLGDRPARRKTVYSYLRHFFHWALEKDLVEFNPCLGIRSPRAVRPRERILSDQEIRTFWGCSDLIATLAKVELLTAQRMGAIAKMKWPDVDLIAGEWSVAGADTKTRKPIIVPLSATVVDLLQEFAGANYPYVFGFGTLGEKPYNGRSQGMRRMRAKGYAADWRLHDLRRTAVTLAQRGGAVRDEIEALTQHKRGGVYNVYARHDYATEKRKVVNIIEEVVGDILAFEAAG